MRDTIRSLPDDHPCYVPGYGETTLGEIRRPESKVCALRATEQPAAVESEWALMLERAAWVAVNPHKRPSWASGRTRKGSAGSTA